MASYLPPTDNLPNFNPNVFQNGDDTGITLTEADSRYVKKSGSIMTGSLSTPSLLVNGISVENKLSEITSIEEKTTGITYDDTGGIDTTTIDNNVSINGKVEIIDDTTSQLLVKPESLISKDAVITIRGARNGSTSDRTCQLRFENYDNDLSDHNDLGEICGIVQNAASNIGGMLFSNFSDGATRTTAATMNFNGRWHFGNSFQDSYKLQVTGNSNFIGVVNANSGGVVINDSNVDNTIDNRLANTYTSAQGYTFFDQSISLTRSTGYRHYSIGILGDNTTNDNVFAIGGNDGSGDEPNIVFAINNEGNAEFAGNLILPDVVDVGEAITNLETATTGITYDNTSDADLTTITNNVRIGNNRYIRTPEIQFFSDQYVITTQPSQLALFSKNATGQGIGFYMGSSTGSNGGESVHMKVNGDVQCRLGNLIVSGSGKTLSLPDHNDVDDALTNLETATTGITYDNTSSADLTTIDNNVLINGLIQTPNSPVNSFINRILLYKATSTGTDYGFGIKANTLTYHSSQKHEFIYGSTTTTQGTTGMTLDQNNLTVNGNLNLPDHNNVDDALTDLETATTGITYASASDTTTISNNVSLERTTFSIEAPSIIVGDENIPVSIETPIQVSTSSVTTAGKGTIHMSIPSGGTEGDGNLATGISFSRINTNRRGALIASFQDSSDRDRCGLKFFTKDTTTTATDAVETEALTIRSDGKLETAHTFTSQQNIILDAPVDSAINNPFDTLYTPANGYTFFDKSIQLERSTGYNTFYIGMLGDNTTNDNVFAIAGDDGVNPDPDIMFAISNNGTAEFNSSIEVNGAVNTATSVTASEEIYANGGLEAKFIRNRWMRSGNTNKNLANGSTWGSTTPSTNSSYPSSFGVGGRRKVCTTNFVSESNGVFTFSEAGTYNIRVTFTAEMNTATARKTIFLYFSINDDNNFPILTNQPNERSRMGSVYLRDINTGLSGTTSFGDYIYLNQNDNFKCKCLIDDDDADQQYNDTLGQSALDMYVAYEFEKIADLNVISSW